MNKRTEREVLQDAVNYRQSSAEFERRELLLSLGGLASGFATVGARIGNIMTGEVAGGTLLTGLGGGIVAMFGSITKNEFKEYTRFTAEAAVKQYQLSELDAE